MDPPRVSPRISILLWADILVGYALFVMQDYLTTVWNLSFTHAAGILNVWTGISTVLPSLFFYLVEAEFLRNFKVLVISSISYSVGIGLVTLSTPPVLGGSCKRYEEECIGQKQRALFYAGMALIAVGAAGNKVSVQPMIDEHQGAANHERRHCGAKLLSVAAVAIVALAGAFGLPYVKPWELRFGIPAIFAAVAMAVFLISGCVVPYRRNGGQPIVNGRGGRGGVIATTPIWLAFVACGVVSSVENTYFVEQATNLERHVGRWNVPLQIFMLVSQVFKAGFGFVSSKAVSSWRLGIGTAMVFSVLGCVTAAKIERRRLGVVRRHGLLDEPDDDIPMSIYWLLFQFVLLAGLDSFLEDNVKKFYRGDEEEEEESTFAEHFAKSVSGLGNVLGVLSVYVVGKVSESKGRRHENWFQPTLNESRLDLYYWVLAVMGGVNLLYFLVVAPFYRR